MSSGSDKWTIVPYRPIATNDYLAALLITVVATLAFAPLAFPTVATPYGIALLTLAMTLASSGVVAEPNA